MPTATALHSTDTTNLSATVVSNNNPVIATTVTFSSGAGGTVAPATANTDTQGVANTTFTAGAVTQDTPVTVTAKAGAQGSTVITVKPVVGFDDFGTGTATGAATAQITVSPSVVVGNGIQCTYDIVHNTSVGAAASPITVTVNFQIPMRLVSATSPQGTVSSNSTGGGTAWIFWIPDPSYTGPSDPVRGRLKFQSMNIVLKGDGSPGGTARFDILEAQTMTPEHANINVTGPLP